MSDLVTYALTSVADVKESMGIASGDTSWDNIIKRKINQATDMIENYCGLDNDHHFKETTYTNEEYDGTGTTELFLKARFVTAVSSLQVRSTTENSNDWDTIDTEDYFYTEHSGLVKALFGFYEHYNLYRISYTAGFSTIPSELAEACVSLAAYLVDNGTAGQAVKKKTEGSRSIEYAVSMTEKGILEQLGIDEVLARYVMPSLAGW